MLKLIKDLSYVQIYEEEKNNRIHIFATNHKVTEPLTSYVLDTYNKNENRRNFFRSVALSYFNEIKSRFETN